MQNNEDRLREVKRRSKHENKEIHFMLGDEVKTRYGRFGVVGVVFVDYQAAVDFGFVEESWIHEQIPPKSDRYWCAWYGVYLPSGERVLCGDNDMEWAHEELFA